jgi:hypothetical protein
MMLKEFVARRRGRRKGGSRSDPVAARPAARTATPRAVERVALPAPDMRELEAQARDHRDRLALYRARVLSAKPTSAARLRELQRISTAADARLRDAARRDGADGAVNRHGAL